MLLQETYPCQDIFIIGGQSDGKSPIDITINSMPEQWNSYNSWMIGDNYLDWDGTEADQGTFNGYEASGTAAAFTSNDPSDKFYFELNDFCGNSSNLRHFLDMLHCLAKKICLYPKHFLACHSNSTDTSFLSASKI